MPSVYREKGSAAKFIREKARITAVYVEVAVGDTPGRRRLGGTCPVSSWRARSRTRPSPGSRKPVFVGRKREQTNDIALVQVRNIHLGVLL